MNGRRNIFKTKYIEIAAITIVIAIYLLMLFGVIVMFVTASEEFKPFAGGLVILAITLFLGMTVLHLQKQFAPKFNSAASDKLKYHILLIPTHIVGAFGFGVALLAFTYIDISHWNNSVFIYKLIGAILAYLLCNHVYPGAPVASTSYNRLSHVPRTRKKQEEENKRKSNLIKNYTSKKLILGVAIAYVLLDSIVFLPQYKSLGSLSSDMLFFYLFFYMIGLFVFLNGFKYLSAWLNLRKLVQTDLNEIKKLNESLIV